MQNSITLLIAGILGATGVGLGAFGAHSLKARLLEAGTLPAWQTAVQYHLIHAVALLAIGLFADTNILRGRRAGRINILFTSWTVGILLFSGSLYWLALGGPRWLGPLTPVGGAAFMVGWIAVACGAMRARPE